MSSEPNESAQPDRRSWLRSVSTVLMAGSLAAAYGTLAAFLGRFLYPARRRPSASLFVCEVARLQPGESLLYRTPDGAGVTVARKGTGTGAADFVALSSVCPHLGCQVHWEGHNDRFFCPCHNGVFDPDGRPLSGPPAEAGQSLGRYPLAVKNGLLFIDVPVVAIGRTSDRCLGCDGRRA